MRLCQHHASETRMEAERVIRKYALSVVMSLRRDKAARSTMRFTDPISKAALAKKASCRKPGFWLQLPVQDCC